MVQWLRQTAHDQEVMGSIPGTIYWMDVSDASYYMHIKITKIKVAEWGTSKKIKIKKINKIKTFDKGRLKKYMDFFQTIRPSNYNQQNLG